MRSVLRPLAGALGALVVALGLGSPALAAAGAGPVGQTTTTATRFDTVADMKAATGLSGTVVTDGDEEAGDGSGMTFEITSTLPKGALGSMAVSLDDGQYAVPQGLATSPATSPDPEAVEDLLSRARTFAEAGDDLVWDSSRLTPLSGEVVHSTMSRPYAVTCSSFVGMALAGWDYSHTTYVADENSQVGYGVDFGDVLEDKGFWSANNLASWFYANGDVWLGSEGGYEPGDILFFSEQDPRGQSDSVQTGDVFFGNVYHTAIYLGDNQLIHSTGPSADSGVVVTQFWASLEVDLSFVARPAWGYSSSSSRSAAQDQDGAQGGQGQGAQDEGAADPQDPQDGGEAAGAEEGAEGAQGEDPEAAQQQDGAQGGQGQGAQDEGAADPQDPQDGGEAAGAEEGAEGAQGEDADDPQSKAAQDPAVTSYDAPVGEAEAAGSQDGAQEAAAQADPGADSDAAASGQGESSLARTGLPSSSLLVGVLALAMLASGAVFLLLRQRRILQVSRLRATVDGARRLMRRRR
ncbi:hypothetical protein [Actinomyces wuliandei]|uniref:hypothetical protein n=1 Tax=Actinomyces wuliandei TaxID=2057743 RepID=UPI000FDB85B7|nr:hypothetical protein [Actinomyces wuliandei]